MRDASAENWGLPAHYVPGTARGEHDGTGVRHRRLLSPPRLHTQEPTLAKLEMLLAKDETRHEMFYEQKTKDCLDADPSLMPMVLDALKEFGMPGAYLLDDYGERRAAMEQAAFPTLADKKGSVHPPLRQADAHHRRAERHARVHRRQLPLRRGGRPVPEEDAPRDDYAPHDAAPRVAASYSAFRTTTYRPASRTCSKPASRYMLSLPWYEAAAVGAAFGG